MVQIILHFYFHHVGCVQEIKITCDKRERARLYRKLRNSSKRTSILELGKLHFQRRSLEKFSRNSRKSRGKKFL